MAFADWMAQHPEIARDAQGSPRPGGMGPQQIPMAGRPVYSADNPPPPMAMPGRPMPPIGPPQGGPMASQGPGGAPQGAPNILALLAGMHGAPQPPMPGGPQMPGMPQLPQMPGPPMGAAPQGPEVPLALLVQLLQAVISQQGPHVLPQGMLGMMNQPQG